jgi:hypothetical protein
MADRLRVTELDFDTIKQNLKTFLNQQTEFTDYDFEGSGLSVLLDILAYNTHYQAYYLNMIANEAFLDTALLRDSVVSHAKTLGYVPYSRKAPVATINFTVSTNSSNTATLTIPKGFRFLSDDIDDVSYNFVTLSETVVTKANTDFSFLNLKIYEGQLVSYSFVQSDSTNPKQVFTLPDAGIDTTTLTVTVQPSESNTDVIVYTLASDASNTSSQAPVFYLQENKSEKYDIYFGDDVIGKKLPDGGIVNVTYLVTNADAANKANNFVATDSLVDSLGNSQTNFTINPISEASGGAERESVDEIKFSAPLQYTTQNRLVTTKDYESYIKKNYPSVDSLSVWGGEDEIPRVYGKVFISLKPRDNYYLSEAEKQRILDEIVGPKSIISVSAEIRDPDYLYILLNNQVKYDSKKTTFTEAQLTTQIRNAIINYKQTYLNKFNAIFALSKVQDQIDNVDTNAIIGSETTVKLQKRITPELNQSSNYTITFGVPIKRGTLTDRLTTTEFSVFDSTGVTRTAIIEEIPQSFTGVSSIEIINPGYGYTSTPTVTISGDGTGATAEAVIEGGTITQIRMINRGTDYTRATVSITGGGGYSGSATAVIDSKVGTLRVIYYDVNANRQIIDENVGEINYDTGIITLNDLKILSVSSADGLLRFTAVSEEGIIESTRNSIITIDDADATSIVTTLEKMAS